MKTISEDLDLLELMIPTAESDRAQAAITDFERERQAFARVRAFCETAADRLCPGGCCVGARGADDRVPVYEMGSGKLIGHVGAPPGSRYQPEPEPEVE